jgi:hypothetical protein
MNGRHRRKINAPPQDGCHSKSTEDEKDSAEVVQKSAR